MFKIRKTRMPEGKNQERLSKKLKEASGNYDWTNVRFPTPLEDIRKFTKNNGIPINVFCYVGEFNKKEVRPLLIQGNSRDTINLLYLMNDTTSHYTWIKNMSRLMSSEKNNHQHEIHYCYRCLNSFNSIISPDKHDEYCSNNECIKTVMPEEGKNILKFTNIFKTQDVPFVIHADFESFIKPIETTEKDPSRSYTSAYNHHKPSGWCLHLKCFDDNIHWEEPIRMNKKNSDDDLAKSFVLAVEDAVKRVYEKFKVAKPMIYGPEEKLTYEQATKCWLCEGRFNKSNYKVRDHCHLTGKFRGAAHNKCNLKFRLPKFIPVIFHNLSGYDAHLFVKSLGVTDGQRRKIYIVQ